MFPENALALVILVFGLPSTDVFIFCQIAIFSELIKTGQRASLWYKPWEVFSILGQYRELVASTEDTQLQKRRLLYLRGLTISFFVILALILFLCVNSILKPR